MMSDPVKISAMWSKVAIGACATMLALPAGWFSARAAYDKNRDALTIDQVRLVIDDAIKPLREEIASTRFMALQAKNDAANVKEMMIDKVNAFSTSLDNAAKELKQVAHDIADIRVSVAKGKP